MSDGIRAHLGMAFRHKTGLIIVTIAVVLLAALLFVVLKLINVDRYRSEVIAYLERKTGKQIEIGNLALSFSYFNSRRWIPREESTVISAGLHRPSCRDRRQARWCGAIAPAPRHQGVGLGQTGDPSPFRSRRPLEL